MDRGWGGSAVPLTGRPPKDRVSRKYSACSVMTYSELFTDWFVNPFFTVH